MTKLTVELQPWQTPNFVTQKMPPRPRQDGPIEGPKFALADLTPEILSDLCDEFRKEVFRKSGMRDPQVRVEGGDE